jgi:hypothetical protein
MDRKLSTKRVYLQTGAGILIACGLIAFYIPSIFKSTQSDQTWSAIVSLEARLLSLSQDPNSELQQYFQHAEKQWQILSDDEYDKVTAILEQDGFRIDARHPQGYPVDTWDNRLVILFRRLSDGQLDFRIESKGPDGTHGTKDDITSPHNPVPPTE